MTPLHKIRHAGFLAIVFVVLLLAIKAIDHLVDGISRISGREILAIAATACLAVSLLVLHG
jgi:hypothetical protein